MTFSPDTPAIALPLSVTPGGYMKTCRQRAGLSIAQCAEKVGWAAHDRARARAEIAALEADRPGDYNQLLRHLQAKKVFRFDPVTFSQLALATCSPELEEVGAAA